MPFIWRQKNLASSAADVHPEAIACLDAAYVLVDIGNGTEKFSGNLHTLLDRSIPVGGIPAVLEALKPESAARFQQALAAIRQGQVTAPVVLHLKDSPKTLICRSAIAPAPQRAGVLWLYDISAEFRAQARLTQESEKLKSDLKHYSTILNMAPYPIWQRDAEMKVRFYNLAYSEVAEASDSAGDEAPDLDRRSRALAEAALASGEPKIERRHIVVGGQRHLFEMRELPIPQEKMVIGFAQDVTEIEMMQAELERYISAQGDLLESSASAMAIYGADMRLQSFNYAFVALWKLDETWLDTKPAFSEILEVLREKRKLPEQANFVQFKQQQLRLFRDLIEPKEEFFYLPDGKALRVIVIPHALGGLLFAYEDVTDRLTLERSYNTLIAVQRETLDNLHEGVAVFGEDGKLKLSNPVYLAMWGLDASAARDEIHITEMVERVKQLLTFDDWETFKSQFAAQIQSRTFLRSRIERADGKVIDSTTVPLPDGATLITDLDVTDSTVVERSLRERNEALQEADRLKSEFLANVSYELRSPLTTIGGFAEMLRQEYFGGLTEKQKEYVEGIHQSSQHLMQLINDILDLASIEAGYMQLDVTRFDVRSMMQSVLPLVQERVKEHDLTLNFECPARIGKMVGDETRLKQILFKLLSNAIKFSPPGRTIVLSARAEDKDHVVLSVTDEGYGIPQEEQQAVFGTFYKGSNRNVPKAAARSGAGLGLSMVKSFVELHGGNVELESVPSSGTSIHCGLPREYPPLLVLVKQKPARRRGGGEAAKEPPAAEETE